MTDFDEVEHETISYAGEPAMERNIIAELTEIVHSDLAFSDIRLAQGSLISICTPDGWIELTKYAPTTENDLEELMKLIDPDWAENLQKGAINRPKELANWRLRMNGYLGFGGEKMMMVIRRLPATPPTLSETGLPNLVRIMLQAPRGLILVSGATGAGKSTTTAAMVDAINAERRAHIVTIEDPIEYVYKSKKALFSQREVGPDTPSFAAGLEDAMRQHPEVIVVGEIRDRATAETAILAGESGHLVIGTIHANTAAGTVQKMLQFFNDSERGSKLGAMAGSLIGVINQILVPTQDRKKHALAVEIINNSDQDFSPFLGDTQKLAALLRDKDRRRGSMTMAESLADLVGKQQVAKIDAFRAVVGMPGVADELKRLTSG